jgi:hypothetical protein
MRDESGQATVEVVALVPLLALVAAAALQALAAGAAGEAAHGAAEAGAVALLEGTDPRAAARSALSDGARQRAEIHVDGRVVRVRLRPSSIVPGAAPLLVADARADAGAPR